MDNEVLHTARRDAHSVGGEESNVVLRNRPRSLGIWRPSSLMNLVSPRTSRVLHTSPSAENINSAPSWNTNNSLNRNDKRKSSLAIVKSLMKRESNTIVNVVVVEAKLIPDPPSDGSTHTVFCKVRLGSETRQTKSVPSSHRPEWRERLTLHWSKEHLQVTLCDKGKQMNFMGSCIVDLSRLEMERAHEIWQELENGFGSIHLNITMCALGNMVPTPTDEKSLDDLKEKFGLFKLDDWRTVGQLRVRVYGARGLSGRPAARCTLELDNERVQTPKAKTGCEPDWNKCYLFNVYDVTSTLDLKVADSSLVSLGTELLGRVSIPLLRIRNGEARWYALKDRAKRNSAKGNCPRVLLEMSLVWNPVKAAFRLFQPKEVKYIKKAPKFDVALVYNNLEFVRDTFVFLMELNEMFKNLLEWENRELCSVALVGWLLFWYYFQPWVVPLVLLIPFVLFWIFERNADGRSFMRVYSSVIEEVYHDSDNSSKNEKSLTGIIQGAPEMTLVITRSIEYIVSLVERLYNLLSFKVPFLSYLAMLLLVGASLVLYYIPFNYLIMAFGTYKYTRKHFSPDRKPNNDILDFISRLPDNEILKEWKELNVPEPNNHPNLVKAFSRSLSQERL